MSRSGSSGSSRAAANAAPFPSRAAAPPVPISSRPAQPPIAKADVMLRGFTRDGVVHVLGGEKLPDGVFVKIIRE